MRERRAWHRSSASRRNTSCQKRDFNHDLQHTPTQLTSTEFIGAVPGRETAYRSTFCFSETSRDGRGSEAHKEGGLGEGQGGSGEAHCREEMPPNPDQVVNRLSMSRSPASMLS